MDSRTKLASDVVIPDSQDLPETFETGATGYGTDPIAACDSVSSTIHLTYSVWVRKQWLDKSQIELEQNTYVRVEDDGIPPLAASSNWSIQAFKKAAIKALEDTQIFNICRIMSTAEQAGELEWQCYILGYTVFENMATFLATDTPSIQQFLTAAAFTLKRAM
ncbi:hypothetical protein PtB15_13B498 [Puccinia triticina]|nr:hypothetical protein PtB15_13B498 [Puccinia triticina]